MELVIGGSGTAVLYHKGSVGEYGAKVSGLRTPRRESGNKNRVR